MGSLPSKASRAAPRKYPTTPSNTTMPQPKARGQPKLQRHPPTNEAKSNAIRADGMDPDAAGGDFSQRLQQMGIVQPNPTYSPSSTASAQRVGQAAMETKGPLSHHHISSKTNPTLSALQARQRLQQLADSEIEHMGSANSKGRQLIDMRTLVEALRLLDHGMSQTDVEKKLHLAEGLLKQLGGPRLLSHETTAG